MIEVFRLNETVMTATTVAVALLSTLILYFSKNIIDAKIMKREKEEVVEAIKDYKIIFHSEKKGKDNENNVLEMMYDNVSELREYYVISKQQARKSFSAALVACIFGFIIYLLGIITTILFDTDVSVISIVGGSTAEVISAMFFWLYREATKQLSVYHQRLGSTEKYLTAIQIIKNLPEEKKNEQYCGLIEHILQDNQEIIKRENSVKE